MLSFPRLAHQQRRGSPDPEAGSPARLCGWGSGMQLGCAWGSCVWALPPALPSVGSGSKGSLDKHLGVCWWSDPTRPLLFWCCACPLCAACLWIADEYRPAFLQYFFFFVSLLNVYFIHFKLDLCPSSPLFLAVLGLCSSPGLGLHYPTVNNLAPSEEALSC